MGQREHLSLGIKTSPPRNTSGAAVGMMQSQVVGRLAKIFVTDPWDFMTEFGTEPLEGKVEDLTTDGEILTELLISLPSPVVFQNFEISLILASPRHVKSIGISRFMAGDGLLANMISVPAAHIEAAKRFDSTWWRGGLGLIGEVSLDMGRTLSP
jgi:hypothetical protein